MSAYVVDRAHIAAMVRLALEGPTDQRGGYGQSWTLTWYASDPRETAEMATDSADYFRRLESIRRTVTRETAQRVGRLLMVANVASVSHRYPDDTPDNLPGRMDHWWTDLAAAVALHYMYYNFARPHSALGRNVTPAMAAGLADHCWTVEEVCRLIESN